DKYSRLLPEVQYRRLERFRQVHSSAGGLDARFSQSGQRFGQPGDAPIQNMIVGDNAAVNLRCSEARSVGGVHSVIDAFWVMAVRGCYGRLQINDSGGRVLATEFRDRVTPYVLETHGLWYCAMDSLSH